MSVNCLVCKSHFQTCLKKWRRKYKFVLWPNKNSKFCFRHVIYDLLICHNFTCFLHRYAVPDTPYAIHSNVQSSDLNNLVNAVLKETISTFEKAVEFDFLVCGELLCTSLSEHLQEKGVSLEDTLEIEYLERFPAPTPQDCLMHDDWVSAVHVHNNW